MIVAMKRQKVILFLAAISAVFTAAPLLAVLGRFGVAAPLSFFDADAFYYLDITRNSAGRSGYTFDGMYPTNGFHPLWQYLLSFLNHIGWLNFADPWQPLLRVFALSSVLLALGAAAFTVFAARQLKCKPLALFVSAPGLVWFFSAPITQKYLASWSFANGMESALSLLMMALAFALAPGVVYPGSAGSERHAGVVRDLSFSVLLGLGVLARLDDVFFVVALAAWGVLIAGVPVRRVALWSVPAAVMVLAYMSYNRATIGVFLPLSGAAKAGAAFRVNAGWLGKLLIPMFTKNAPSVLDTGGPADPFTEAAIRAFQMAVPAVLCLSELFLSRRRLKGKPQLLHALCLGVVLKAAYNFLFVAGSNQGVWYYTVSLAVANLILVVWIGRVFAAAAPESSPFAARSVVALYIVVASFSFSALYGALTADAAPFHHRQIVDGRGIAAAYRAGGDRCFTELDDGILTYALRMPAEAGIGLALDREATTALKRGDLFRLLVQRGCTLVLASDSYAVPVEQYLSKQSWKHGEGLWLLRAHEFDAYKMVPLGTRQYDGITAFRIRPRFQDSRSVDDQGLFAHN